MNAHPKFVAASAHVDEAAIQPLPRSRKVYVEGWRPDIRVPMREISQTDTPASWRAYASRVPSRLNASSGGSAAPASAPLAFPVLVSSRRRVSCGPQTTKGFPWESR